MRKTTAVTILSAGLLAAPVLADTLVLRNGREISGDLVSVRGDSIEFHESSLFGRGNTRTYDRREVERIELDRYSSGSSGNSSSSRNDDRDTGNRPSGLREREVTVTASRDWTDTRVDVRAGQSIYFIARGKVRWGKDRQDDAGGEHNSPRNAGRPIPNRAGGALIGRVGNDDAFFIGDDEGEIRAPSSGRLYLGVNDDYLPDNSGSFQVTVSY